MQATSIMLDTTPLSSKYVPDPIVAFLSQFFKHKF